MKDADDLAQAKLASIKKYVDSKDVPATALMKMAKLGAVIDQWMAATEVGISAIQCWTSLEENFGVVPCTIMSMMSDQLLSSACEIGYRGSARDARFAAGLRNAFRAAGLEQQLRDGSRTRPSVSTVRICLNISSARSRWISSRSLPGRWARKTPTERSSA